LETVHVEVFIGSEQILFTPILPHVAHSAGYSKNRHLMWYAMRNFLAAPAPAAA